MAKPEKGIGFLRGIGPKKPEKEEESEESGAETSEVKRAAAEAMISAFNAGDAEALVEALDAFLMG